LNIYPLFACCLLCLVCITNLSETRFKVSNSSERAISLIPWLARFVNLSAQEVIKFTTTWLEPGGLQSTVKGDGSNAGQHHATYLQFEKLVTGDQEDWNTSTLRSVIKRFWSLCWCNKEKLPVNKQDDRHQGKTRRGGGRDEEEGTVFTMSRNKTTTSINLLCSHRIWRSHACIISWNLIHHHNLSIMCFSTSMVDNALDNINKKKYFIEVHNNNMASN
jgi:hypothetical protein